MPSKYIKTYEKQGQPAKYNLDDEQVLADIEVKILAAHKEGKSNSQIAAMLNVCDRTMTTMLKHPAMKRIWQLGQQYNSAYWDELGKQYLVQEKDGATINVAMYALQRRNRHRNYRVDDNFINLPDGFEDFDYAQKISCIQKEVRAGRITPKDAKTMTEVVTKAFEITEAIKLQERVQELEKLLAARDA